MNSGISFARFDSVLEQLGFQRQVVPDSHVHYELPSRDAHLLIRLHKPKDLVPDYVLFGAKHDLESQGIIAADEFERMLNSAAA